MNHLSSINRTKNYFKQLRSSFIFKFFALLASFFAIPLMIKYLGTDYYGVWSTLVAIVSWMTLLDIGIGNGLRNKIAESLAKENNEKVQYYISTAYFIIGIIMLVFIAIFLLVSEYIKWQNFFNIYSISNQEIKVTINIVVTSMSLNFILALINQIFNGFQKTAITVLNQFLFNLFTLISIFILYKYFESSLSLLAFAYAFCLLTPSLILSFWFYHKNKIFLPKIKFVDKRYAKSLTSLGFQFFIIQIAVIVIFATDKILITQFFGPQYVTSYDIVFKLFSIITIIFSLTNTPLLSAYNDAYVRKDLVWMRYTIQRQLKMYIFVIVFSILLYLFAQPIIDVWIGSQVEIKDSLILLMCIYVIIVSFGSIYSTVLGGIGYIRLGVYQTIFEAIINIPLSYYFAVVQDLCVQGILIGTILSIAFGLSISVFQVYYFIYANFKNDKLTRILR